MIILKIPVNIDLTCRWRGGGGVAIVMVFTAVAGLETTGMWLWTFFLPRMPLPSLAGDTGAVGLTTLGLPFSISNSINRKIKILQIIIFYY